MSDKDRDGMNSEELAEERTELAEQRTEYAEHRTEEAELRTEDAEERTEWALNRTVLANERTFIAWLRTGMASIGVGLGIAEFLAEADAERVATALGLLLIVLGGGMTIIGLRRYNKVSRELKDIGIDIHPSWMVYGIVIGLIIVTVLAIALVIIE
jgi:putative membrane protein